MDAIIKYVEVLKAAEALLELDKITEARQVIKDALED